METKSIGAHLGRKTSSMWYFFTIINENVARCKNCKKTLSYRSSTSNLKKHLQKSHRPLFNDLQNGRVPSIYKTGREEDEADGDAIERSFEVELEEPYNDDVNNDEDYTPPVKKRPNVQVKSESKSLRCFRPQNKAIVAKNIVHNSSRLKPMVEYDDSDNDEEDNEFDLLGKFICSQLEKLTKVNAFLAQEEIQSVLTRYKVHELSTEEKSKMMPNTKL